MSPIYIVLAVVTLVLLTLYVFYDYFMDIYIGLQSNYRYTRMVKRIARLNDYLALSDICVRISEDEFGIIRHLLIADKYIYVIMGRTMTGAITGLGEDEKWLHKDGKLVHIPNPLKENRRLLKALATQLKMQESDFVNVVIFAKTAIVDDIPLANPNDAVLEEQDFPRFIKMMEKTAPVNDFDPQSAENLVSKIIKLNEYNLKLRNSQVR